MKISYENIVLDQDYIEADGCKWQFAHDCAVVLGDSRVLFDEFEQESRSYKMGVGEGILTHYKHDMLEFETLCWIEYSTKWIYFELYPIHLENVTEVKYPGSFIFDTNTNKHYTLINHQQGLLIPNNWPVDLDHLPFNGQMNSAAAYMPWFGQVKDGHGYIAIALSDDDMAYEINHNSSSHSTMIALRTLSSLGRMEKSISCYQFLNHCDYNDLCKLYRKFAIETNRYVSLKEKEIRNPSIKDFMGRCVVHKGIKTHISPDSEFYDKENTEKNDILVTFRQRKEEIQRMHELGASRIYFHLDGWGQPGYDNQHPDYLPACFEAGGYEGLKELADYLKQQGDMLGLHDQYRDYYFDARTFDKEFALMEKDGNIFEMTRWAGGHQSYLCASQAKYYVKRNFEELFHHGIEVQGSYLDVFTCNEMDECFNPHHMMTRKQCREYRKSCFDYVLSKGILTSSEEMNEYALHSLVFCHYAPYDFMLARPDAPRYGLPVPLFNLVYHECVVIPWFMDENKEDYMLYALLNGGMPYLDKDGAYPNIDGAFDESYQRDMKHKIERARIVSDFQEKVAYCELVRHELLDEKGLRQRSAFSNGSIVEVNFENNEYRIFQSYDESDII